MLRPFERGDAARNAPNPDLVLVIAKRVVERHDGSLVLGKSALGGASVAVRLPPLGTD